MDISMYAKKMLLCKVSQEVTVSLVSAKSVANTEELIVIQFKAY